MGLQDFERRLERLVEGVFTKAFRSKLTPVEVARRIVREMDARRTEGVRGVIAPNHFTVAVSTVDHEYLGSFGHTVIRELADYAREHAREEHYQFVGPVEVEFHERGGLGRGEFEVTAEMREREGGGPVGTVVMGDGSRVSITDAALTIGRDSDCDIVVTPKEVSRRHAEIHRDGEAFVVVDLGSMNGTTVNGSGIGTNARRLADGDQIVLGGVVTMRFETS